MLIIILIFTLCISFLRFINLIITRKLIGSDCLLFYYAFLLQLCSFVDNTSGFLFYLNYYDIYFKD